MDISGLVKADSKKEGLSPLFYLMLFLFLIFLYEVRCFFKTFAVCSDSAIATIYCYLDIVAITKIIIFVYLLDYNFCIFFHFDFLSGFKALKTILGFVCGAFAPYVVFCSDFSDHLLFLYVLILVCCPCLLCSGVLLSGQEKKSRKRS